jgi:hypothetical protein
MKIDIDRFTETELLDMAWPIGRRLRLLQQVRAHAPMLQRWIGDQTAAAARVAAFPPTGTP